MKQKNNTNQFVYLQRQENQCWESFLERNDEEWTLHVSRTIKMKLLKGQKKLLINSNEVLNNLLLYKI